MRSIQDVGLEILTNNPKSFYIFLGDEIGIKTKYLKILSNLYNNNVFEMDTVESVLSIMKTRHIIPIDPSLYIIRYDESFLLNLNDKLQSQIQSMNIIGTIVCIYEDSKQAQKLDKYLPEFTVNIVKVDLRYNIKYLGEEFKTLPESVLSICAQGCDNYGSARLMCLALSKCKQSDVLSLNSSEILSLFGHLKLSAESDVRIGVASKNFSYLCNVLERYPGDDDSILYSILSTMVELEKLLYNRRAQSDIREYVKKWNHKDVYYMFHHAYNELRRARSMTVDIRNRILYLFSLLQFQSIPEWEVPI